MKKIIFNILILFFLNNCGFSPIYLQEKDVNYNVQIGIVEGDRVINNLIVSQLKRNNNKESTTKITELICDGSCVDFLNQTKSVILIVEAGTSNYDIQQTVKIYNDYILELSMALIISGRMI